MTHRKNESLKSFDKTHTITSIGSFQRQGSSKQKRHLTRTASYDSSYKMHHSATRHFSLGQDSESMQILNAITNNIQLGTPRTADITNDLTSMRFLLDYNRSFYRSDTEISFSKERSLNSDILSKSNEFAKNRSLVSHIVSKKAHKSTKVVQKAKPKEITVKKSNTQSSKPKTQSFQPQKKIFIKNNYDLSKLTRRNPSFNFPDPESEYGTAQQKIILDRKRGSFDNSHPNSPRFMIRTVQSTREEPLARASSPESDPENYLTLRQEILKTRRKSFALQKSGMSEIREETHKKEDTESQVGSKGLKLRNLAKSSHKEGSEEQSQAPLVSGNNVNTLVYFQEETKYPKQIAHESPNQFFNWVSPGNTDTKASDNDVNASVETPTNPFQRINHTNPLSTTSTSHAAHRNLAEDNPSSFSCALDNTNKGLSEEPKNTQQAELAQQIKQSEPQGELPQTTAKKLQGSKIKFDFSKKKKKCKITNKYFEEESFESESFSDSDDRSINQRLPSYFEKNLAMRSTLYIKECESSISKFHKTFDELRQEIGHSRTSSSQSFADFASLLHRSNTDGNSELKSSEDLARASSIKLDRQESTVSNWSSRGVSAIKLLKVLEQKEYTTRDNNLLVVNIIPPIDEMNDSHSSREEPQSAVDEDLHAKKYEFRLQAAAAGTNPALNLNGIGEGNLEEANDLELCLEEQLKSSSNGFDWVRALNYHQEEAAATYFFNFFDFLLRKRRNISKKQPDEENCEAILQQEDLYDNLDTKFIFTPRFERMTTHVMDANNDANLIFEMLVFVPEDLSALIENYNANTESIQYEDLSLESADQLKFFNGTFVEPLTTEIITLSKLEERDRPITMSNISQECKLQVLSLEHFRDLRATMNYYNDSRDTNADFFYRVAAAVSDMLQENLMFVSETVMQENKKTFIGTFEDRVKLREKLFSSASKKKPEIPPLQLKLLNSAKDKQLPNSVKDKQLVSIEEEENTSPTKGRNIFHNQEKSPKKEFRQSEVRSSALENKLPTLVSSSSSHLLKATENPREITRNRAHSTGTRFNQSPFTRSDTRNLQLGGMSEETKAGGNEDRATKEQLGHDNRNQNGDERKFVRGRDRLKTYDPTKLASKLLYNHPLRKSLSVLPDAQDTEPKSITNLHSSNEPLLKITLVPQRFPSSDSLQLPKQATLQSQKSYSSDGRNTPEGAKTPSTTRSKSREQSSEDAKEKEFGRSRNNKVSVSSQKKEKGSESNNSEYIHGVGDQAERAGAFSVIKRTEFRKNMVYSRNGHKLDPTAMKMSKQAFLMRNHIKQVESKRKLSPVQLMIQAVKENNILEIEELFMIYPNSFVDCRDQKGNPLLSIAVLGGSLQLVDYLLDRGASVDFQNEDGDTALHIAFAYSHNKIADRLIALGARQDLRNKAGKVAWEVSGA